MNDKSVNYAIDSIANTSTQLSLSDSIIIIGLALIAGLFLRYIYYKYSLTFSSKVSFGNSILLLTISVAAIIAIVKTSIALSLGLVGALSIVRFRTAVKEPYNLAYLLLSICVGISIGASQYLFTLLIAIVGYCSIYYIYKRSARNIDKGELLNAESIDTIALTLPRETNIIELSKIL